MRQKIQQRKGFTLIELLVVMTIIVVLASVGLVSYQRASQGARNGKRKSDIETVRQALVLFQQEIGYYPNSSASNASRRFELIVSNSLGSGNYLSQPYPADGSTTYNYTYTRDSEQEFCVCAYLEGSNKGNASDSSCSFGTGNYYCAVEP